MVDSAFPSISSRAPGKVILFGEHAVNRGQGAVAASVGLSTTCRLQRIAAVAGDATIVLVGAGRSEEFTMAEVADVVRRVDDALAAQEYAAISALVAEEFFASSVYIIGRVLADHGPAWAGGVRIEFGSDIPMSCGLGSGGAVHVALAVTLAELLGQLGRDVPIGSISHWAYLGDCVAHGGVASGLDTQTSLLGGVINYRAGQPGRPLRIAQGLRLVIGHTGVAKGSTGNVNARVRTWLSEDPTRVTTFEDMGALAIRAVPLLEAGRWAEVGALMNQAHGLLDRIGASHPDLNRLCDAARAAGAYGAKLTGAGGGGVMIALVSASVSADVVTAIQRAGGTPFTPAIAVPGAALIER